MSAAKSLPPVEASTRTTKPTPMPTSAPPITVAMNISSSKRGSLFVSSRAADKNTIPATVFTTEPLPRYLYPKANKTALNARFVTESGILKRYSRIVPIAPTPPDDSLHGTKNRFIPIAITTAPIAMHIYSDEIFLILSFIL